MIFHQPVLVKEVIDLFDVKPGHIYFDGTLGHGGHTIEILKLGGIVYGLDADPYYLNLATDRIRDLKLDKNFHPILGNFTQMSQFNNLPVNGILLDLGLNSHQQLAIGRGFSFNDTESLDMSLNPDSEDITAEYIVNTYDQDQLTRLFSKTTQEKLAKPIAIKIISSRHFKPIKSGKRLADIVTEVYQSHHLKTKIHPATKVFLALKITVNQEYVNLKSVLESSLKLNPNCIISIISFHSGEDRLVKQFIRTHSVTNLTPKPIRPGIAEIHRNPLSRSAILRSYRID
ncbi:MAG: 16S rRNA (cytosine(1402)-N(4))-methyltransferase RsmH [Candidatus Shapirobacteria bacterium]|nr:16S rRNA (cytosine(1402)-N(4))-methyltransferase RsmH [Candidatus Shapirobacteria bacterium]